MKQLFILIFCLLPMLATAQNSAEEQAILSDPNYAVLRNALDPIEKKAQTLTDEYKIANQKEKEDEVYVQSMNDKYGKVMDEYKSALKTFVLDHPDSPVSLVAFNMLMQGDPDIREIDPAFDAITDRVKNTAIGKQLVQQYNASKKTAIGAKAPEFSQKDPKGNVINLSDFKGKYLLLDFWASWCGPCRKENPNIVKAYNTFKDKNFEILGISLDNPTGRNAWLGAVEKDQLSWPQVSDLGGWKNEVALLYGVQSIPQNFLVDPDGIIIAKNLRGEELTKKLAETLK